MHPLRSNGCCTRLRGASPRALRISQRRAASPFIRWNAASKAISICLQGILGLSNKVRNGFQAIRVNYVVKGDAPEEKLRQIVDQARGRSAVFDILTGHVPVTIEVDL
jgi:hypothetical protein